MIRTRVSLFALTIVFILLLSGCGGSVPAPSLEAVAEKTEVPTQISTLTPTSTATNTPTATPTQPPTSTPTPGPLSASEVFDTVSPSVAFIETPISSGSGMLMRDGYVLTNAHVVWPYSAVRVVFPDGSEYQNTPVVGWDLLTDLAVLGPVETEIPPLELVEGGEKVIGGDVYLLGYPAEMDEFPQPTISRGLISRVREWKSMGLSFFQTDAALAGGQSGGVLVSDRGEVIGISGLRFSEADFGIIASGEDLLSRADMLIASEPSDDMVLDPIPTEGGEKLHRFINDVDETTLFVVYMEAGNELEIEMNGDENVDYYLLDPATIYEIEWESSLGAANFDTYQADISGPHFLVVQQGFSPSGYSSGIVDLSSNRMLIPYDDGDDHQAIRLDSSHYGNIDYPGDIDRYVLVLEAGDIIHTKVESIMIDPTIELGPDGATDGPPAYDDDSGEGILGVDAELSYFIPSDGLYRLQVSDYFGTQTGGYVVSVEKWQGGQPTPVVPTSTPAPLVTEFGDMRRYDGVARPFWFYYPADMNRNASFFPEWFEPLCYLTTACFFSPDTGMALSVVEEDLVQLGLGDMTLDEYADVVQNLNTGQIITQEKSITEHGHEAILLDTDLGFTKAYRQIIIADGAAISIIYFNDPANAADMFPIVEYSLNTFELAD